MLRAYFDGSGKEEDSEFVTLACVIASESVWLKFDEEWSGVLIKYELPAFHMSEAQSLNGKFAMRYGWSKDRVDKLVVELWEVIGGFRSVHQLASGSNLIASSCTVKMEDYRRAKKDHPDLRSCAAICTQFCVNRIPVDVDSRDQHPAMTLLFDRSEPFLRTIDRNWRKLKKQPEAGWPKQIREVSFISSSIACGMQAADLLAWTINKHHREPSFWRSLTFVILEHYARTYEYESLMRQFPNG